MDFIGHFSSVVVQFALAPAGQESCTPSPSFGTVSLCNFSHSGGRLVVCQCGFNLHFPDD